MGIDTGLDSLKTVDPFPDLALTEHKNFKGTQRHISQNAAYQARLISRVAPGADLFIGRVTNPGTVVSGSDIEAQIAQVKSDYS
jgi:hypothetical protein